VTGQFGDFVTLIAKADDGKSTRYVRRLELVGENFARFAMFTNTWQSGLCYSTGEFIRGVGWSNQQWESCGTPTYFDTIGAVGSITGGTPVWKKGVGSQRPNQSVIPLPTVSRLANLPTYAAAANLSFTPTAGRLLRLEFIASDVDANGDSTGSNEGFVRVFRSGTNANSLWFARLPTWDNNGSTKPPGFTADTVCGDFHYSKFYPIVSHKAQWFRDTLLTKSATLPADTARVVPQPASLSDSAKDAERDRVMQNTTARCFVSGSPQLAPVERSTALPRSLTPGATNWTLADTKKGGEDTTFTPNGRWGSWDSLPAPPNAALTASTHTRNMAKWLFPLGRSYNSGFRGVVYVNGDVRVSGQLRSRVTLYSSGQVTFVDDLTYVTPPNAPGLDCFASNANMLGVIAVDSIMIDQTVMHRPQRALRGGSTVKFLNGTGTAFRLHGVVMSLTKTVGVYGYNTGPVAGAGASDCLGATFSGGCIAQVGGVIEQSISATFQGNNTGFAENRQVDQCMMVASPPYFPTTGRYFNNRYFEFDPARFDPTVMYRLLQSGM
jgi:hypothetical protein